MTALQTVNLGTAPTGTDGDTVRVANVKANANVAVLNTQATLTSASPNAVRDLTAADMGKRVNFTPTAAGTVHFPKASDTGADQIVSVHNLATAYDITMAIAAGSGDTAPTIVVVKPGEMLTYETDGVSVWRTIGRKKAFDETVQGKLNVAGATTLTGPVTLTGGVAGALAATGALSGASLAIGTVASISGVGAYSGVSAVYSGAVTVGATLGVTGNATVGGTLTSTGKATLNGGLAVTGASTFSVRPTFNSYTPWDSGNLLPCINGGSNGLTLRWATASATVGLTVDSTSIGGLVTGTGNQHRCVWGSGLTWYVDTTNVGTVSLSSDYRVKQDIRTASDDVLPGVMRVRVVLYRFKDVGIWLDDGRDRFGFVAHELQSEFPLAVNGEKDAVTTATEEDGSTTEQIAPQTLDPIPMIATLWKALQEEYSARTKLEARIDALEGRQ